MKQTKYLLLFILAYLMVLFFAGCGQSPSFTDTTKGNIDPDFQGCVDKIYNLAIDYNAIEFSNRMLNIDIVWSDSEQGKSLLTEYTNEVALSYPGKERVIVIIRENYESQTDLQKFITILHELGHATSDEISPYQHDDTTVIDHNGYIMPLSIMHPNSAMLADFWNDYQDFYLRTFFSLRLDRIWRE